jgi:hypothetical protein
MTREQAKQILLLYRSRRDLEDPEIKAAFEQAQRDPELQQWFERHCAAQRRIKDQFSRLPVPPHLREAIVAGRKIVRPVFWQPPVWLAAAAVIAVFAGVAALWLRPGPFEKFDLYRTRIVSTVWREYRMDILTNDLAAVNNYLAKSGAPTNYVVPEKLQQLTVTGGGKLKWGDEPVSMVCFDAGAQQMLFLFVVKRDSLKGEPEKAPDLHRVSRFQTASWSDAASVYVLVGPDDPNFLRKYGPSQ